MGNPNSVVPLVPIELDRPRTLRLDLNAMVRFEEQTGRDLLNDGGINLRRMRELHVLLWACLLHEDPSLTLDQVGAMIHLGNMQYVAEQVAKVWAASMPEAQREPKKAQRQGASPSSATGSPSGPSDGSTSASETMSSGG